MPFDETRKTRAWEEISRGAMTDEAVLASTLRDVNAARAVFAVPPLHRMPLGERDSTSRNPISRALDGRAIFYVDLYPGVAVEPPQGFGSAVMRSEAERAAVFAKWWAGFVEIGFAERELQPWRDRALGGVLSGAARLWSGGERRVRLTKPLFTFIVKFDKGWFPNLVE